LLEDDSAPSDGELQITLSPWIMLSKDTQVPVPTDWIVTIVEPVSSVKEMYEEKVGAFEEDD